MKNQTIRHVIERSFVMACFIILVMVISAALYFNYSNFKSIRQNSFQHVHDMLSHLLIPELAISNTVEVRRLLTLASTDNETFGVVDTSGNIFIPDYAKVKLLKMVADPMNIVNSCKQLRGSYHKINGVKFWINCTLLYKDNLNADKQNIVGALISFSQQQWSYFSSLMGYFLLVGSAILILLFVWFRRVLYKKLLKPLVVLQARIFESSNTGEIHVTSLGEIGNAPAEVITIKNAFEDVICKLQLEYQRRVENEKKTALLELAAQVVHDIRSPLAVMEVGLVNNRRDKSEESTNVLREAIQRVRDIANNLLDRYRNPLAKVEPVSDFLQINDDGNLERPLLLYSLIETVISQKRNEWQNKGVEIIFEVNIDSKFVWLNIAPNELKRVLSNLLDNAFEALGDHGKIKMFLCSNNSYCQLRICDDGSGIPLDKISLVLNGLSLKHPGKGLGLSGAKKYIEKLNGKLELFSEQEKGTTVLLTFPPYSNPVWFPFEISFKNCDTIVILDDDPAMQSLWVHRLQSYPGSVKRFINYDDAIEWYVDNKTLSHSAIFFVDYQLGEQSKNGLSFLTYANIKKNGYLITSHAEEISIQEAAKNADVWLIPKILASIIPITTR